jgi:predicted outer membrane repeat protein
MLAALLLVGLAVTGGRAAEVQVGPEGDWGGAVAGAAAGTTVVFSAGIYANNCSVDGVAVASGVTLMGSAGAAATVLDCGGAGRHFTIGSGASVRIEGLTLAGGTAAGGNQSEGGCLLASGDGAALAVVDCVFTECSAATLGGAIALREGAQLNISSSSLTRNSAGVGGGAISASHALVQLRDVHIEDNSATFSGGAIEITGCDFSPKPCTLPAILGCWRGQDLPLM